MPTSILRTEEAHLGLIQEQTVRDTYKQLFMSRFVGWAKQNPVTGEYMPTMTPVVMKRDFKAKGMDSMKVPMLRNLTAPEIYGDSAVSGQGEAQSLYYLNTYINKRSSVVGPPDEMANQRVSFLQLVEQARPLMTDKLARTTEVQMMSAFYEGFSRNVTATTGGGISITKRYHPNIYAIDSGKVTWSGTVATHVTNIHNANSGLSAGASDDIMSADGLWNFHTAIRKDEIPPINVNGIDVHILLIHENQMRQLTKDAKFVSAFQNAAERDLVKNPMFSGMFRFFAGFAIFVREFSVFGLSSTSSALTWGATNPLSAVDTYDTKAAICFGQQALCGGWAAGPEYYVEESNHGGRKETSAKMIDGFSRADYYDSTSSPTDKVNKSSAILLTYSPDGWS